MSEEEGSFSGVLVEVSGHVGSFLLVEDGEVPGDVFPDGFDLG